MRVPSVTVEPYGRAAGVPVIPPDVPLAIFAQIAFAPTTKARHVALSLLFVTDSKVHPRLLGWLSDQGLPESESANRSCDAEPIRHLHRVSTCGGSGTPTLSGEAQLDAAPLMHLETSHENHPILGSGVIAPWRRHHNRTGGHGFGDPTVAVGGACTVPFGRGSGGTFAQQCHCSGV